MMYLIYNSAFNSALEKKYDMSSDEWLAYNDIYTYRAGAYKKINVEDITDNEDTYFFLKHRRNGSEAFLKMTDSEKTLLKLSKQ